MYDTEEWEALILGETQEVPLCAKLTHKKHRHSYSCVQTRTNFYGRVRAMCWTIFDRTDMKISLCRIVFRVEFDGDVPFFLAPPKSMFLSIFIDVFDVFCNFFVFQVFVKILIFFSSCRRRAEIFAAAAAAAAATSAIL